MKELRGTLHFDNGATLTSLFVEKWEADQRIKELEDMLREIVKNDSNRESDMKKYYADEIGLVYLADDVDEQIDKLNSLIIELRKMLRDLLLTGAIDFADVEALLKEGE